MLNVSFAQFLLSEEELERQTREEDAWNLSRSPEQLAREDAQARREADEAMNAQIEAMDAEDFRILSGSDE